MKNIYSLFTLLLVSFSINAQSLIDGFSSQKGDLSVTLGYTFSNFDEFYLGTEKMDGVPAHNEITQHIISLYAKYGITDKVSIILNLPYFSASGDGDTDPVNGETSIADFQDISVAFKGVTPIYNFEKGSLDIVGGLGFSIPLGYEPNGILSIGSGVFTVSYTGGLHLNTSSGFFATALANYNLRGDAKSDIIASNFSVPNTFSATGKIGYASSLIYVDAWVSLADSDEGVDIGGEGFTGNFPETNVEYNMFGATVYKDILPELGVSLGYSTIFDGRNVGASSNYSIGFTYNLKN